VAVPCGPALDGGRLDLQAQTLFGLAVGAEPQVGHEPGHQPASRADFSCSRWLVHVIPRIISGPGDCPLRVGQSVSLVGRCKPLTSDDNFTLIELTACRSDTEEKPAAPLTV
jgi:hypothetical protein